MKACIWDPFFVMTSFVSRNVQFLRRDVASSEMTPDSLVSNPVGRFL